MGMCTIRPLQQDQKQLTTIVVDQQYAQYSARLLVMATANMI
jgi:hypothetical protein